MTPIEELCTRLDELGIKHRNYGYKNHVWWEGKDGVGWHAENRPSVKDPYVIIDAEITPKQAIASTVGVGTCHIVKTWTDSDYADHWRYSCSECGYQIEVGERDVATGNPTSHANFCWNCGRRIEVSE